MATSKSTKKTARRSSTSRSANSGTPGSRSTTSHNTAQDEGIPAMRSSTAANAGETTSKRTTSNSTGKQNTSGRSGDKSSTKGRTIESTGRNSGHHEFSGRQNERSSVNRGGMNREQDPGRSNRDGRGYQDDYYADSQRRSYSENDRNTGRNQERYGDNERAQRERSAGRYDRQENFGPYRDSGSGSDRTSYGHFRGNRGNEENYYTEERRSQRSQGWSPYDQQVGTYGDDRQAYGYRRNRRSRPTGKNDEGLRKLFTDQLKDMYWAEKALTKAIPKMIKKATARELINALNDHLRVTEDQVRGLESIFRLIGEKPAAKKCEAMEGLIKESENIIREMDAGSVRDAGIICAGQKVEHYEIATYGCLSTYAEILDEMEIVDILEEILAEEKQADKTLSQVANRINWEAAEEEEEDQDEEEEEEEENDQDEEEQDNSIQGSDRKKAS